MIARANTGSRRFDPVLNRRIHLLRSVKHQGHNISLTYVPICKWLTEQSSAIIQEDVRYIDGGVFRVLFLCHGTKTNEL